MRKLLAAVFLVLTLSLPSLAHADSYTIFQLSGMPYMTGTVTLDSTTGVFMAVDANFIDQGSNGTFLDPAVGLITSYYDTSQTNPAVSGPVLAYLQILGANSEADLFLPTSDLSSYLGGPVCTGCGPYSFVSSIMSGPFLPPTCPQCGLNYDVQPVDGSLIAVTPEPSTLALLGTGLIGLVGVARKRRLFS